MRIWYGILWLCAFALGHLGAFPQASVAVTFYVATTGNDSHPGTAAQPWATLQRAANVVNPGDMVVVQAGHYRGAKFSRSGTATAPITFNGQAGAVIDSPGTLNTNNDHLWIRNANYIILEGFEIVAAPRAGIAIQGEPNAPATGHVLRHNFSHHNGVWGIFTGYAQNVVIEDNETSFSGAEHGIYVSNSADNPVIRGNVVHHNHASGIQINADPFLPGDGIITLAIIEDNIIYENGVGGGAAINLASVRQAKIRNNLLYNNHASGIAGWDDGAGPQFGSKNNRILNNTIVMATDGRFAVVLMNGSTGNKVYNNILLHPGTRGSIEIDQSSRKNFVSDYNLVNNRFSLNDQFISLAQWRAQGYDAHAILAPALAAVFVAPSAADYRLTPGSPAIDTGLTLSGVRHDLAGQLRPQGAAYDMGAYETAAP